jgi:hypothetical protein
MVVQHIILTAALWICERYVYIYIAKTSVISHFHSKIFTIHAGTVTITPPGVARVCSGSHLELMCTTAGGFLRWRFNVTRGFNDIVTSTRTIQSAVPAVDAMFELEVNSTMFNFSRTSAEGSLPVMSTVVISHVSSSLNGTVMNCIDLSTSNLSSTIIIIGEREPLQGMLIFMS